jgi:ankyrin repeat protein
LHCCYSYWQAVKDGNEIVVKEWLKYNKKRVKFRDKDGYAPVHYAAKLNRLEILKLLHEEGKAGKLDPVGGIII